MDQPKKGSVAIDVLARRAHLGALVLHLKENGVTDEEREELTELVEILPDFALVLGENDVRKVRAIARFMKLEAKDMKENPPTTYPPVRVIGAQIRGHIPRTTVAV